MPSAGPPDDRLQNFLDQAARVALREDDLSLETWNRIRVMALDAGLPDGSWEAALQGRIGGGVIWIDPEEGIEEDNDAYPKPPPPPPSEFETRSIPLPPPPPEESLADPEAIDYGDAEIRFVDEPFAVSGSVPLPPPPPPEAEFDGPSSLPPPPPDADGGEPVSTPPNEASTKPRKNPQDRFRAYVEKAFSLMSTPVVTGKKEDKLIEEGHVKLGLSEPFARWIVHELAAEYGLPVLSQQENEEGGALDLDQDRLEVFMDRVAPILAEQRGVNARSRMLMEAVSQELGFSETEFERAMKLLQSSGPRQAQVLRDEHRELREAAFREHLATQLPKLPRGIVVPSMQQLLIEDAVERHGIPDDRAVVLIREACGAHGVRYLSHDQATRHIVELIEEKLGAASWLSTEVRGRIVSEGEQWGLSSDETGALLATTMERNRERRRRSRVVSSMTFLLAALLVVIAAGGGWYVYMESQRNRTAVAENGDEDPDAESEGGEDLSDVGDDADSWPDDELEVDIAAARVNWEEARPMLTQLRDGVLLERREATQALFRLAAVESALKSRNLLIDVLAGVYAQEPNDDNATALLDELSSQLAIKSPLKASAIEHMHWIALTIASAIKRDGLSETRSQALIAMTSDALDLLIDPNQSLKDLQEQLAAALCRKLYPQLAKEGMMTDEDFVESLETLSDISHEMLAPEEQERLEVQLIADAIRGSESRWDSLRPQLRRRAASPETNTILKLVELLEDSKDASLRIYLGTLLASRPDLVRAQVTVDEVADEVRKNLGIPRRASFDDRWSQYDTLSQAALDLLNDEEDDPAQMLRQTAALSHAANAGLALSLRELGASEFDELVENGPPKLESLTSTPLSRPRTPPPEPENFNLPGSRGERIDQLIRTLGASSRRDSRLRILELFAAMAPGIKELSPEHSKTLASYLVRPKQPIEHDGIMEFVAEFRRWKYLRLALADAMQDVTSVDDQLNELMSELTEQRFPQNNVMAWRNAIRGALLRDVLADTSGESRNVADANIVDRAARVLRNLYVHRSALLGVATTTEDNVDNVAQAIELNLDAYANRLSTGKPNDEITTLLEEFPLQRAAIGYVADNELMQTVMLQRLLLRAIAADAKRAHVDRQDTIDAMLQQAFQSDREPKDVLAQLRAGEKFQVELWRIINSP